LSDRGRRKPVRGRAGIVAALVGAVAAGVVLTAVFASTAIADFPYTGPGGNPKDPTTWKLPPGTAPTNFGDDWKLAATPEQSPQSDALVNWKSDELCGVRGDSVVDSSATFPAANSCIAPGTPVRTAFEQTLGRPDVVISVLDSGIEWNNQGAMTALRKKVWLNAGELPAPRVDLHQTFDPTAGEARRDRAEQSLTTSWGRARSTCSTTPATHASPRSSPEVARATRCATGRRECSSLRT
jgi:hypothetical protein